MKIKTNYLVPYADTDQMGVVYYANYFVYFEIGRNNLLKESGIPYTKMEETGFMLPVLEAKCSYYQPAHYDDSLIISAWFERTEGAKITIACEIYCGDTLLVKGYTIHSFVSMASKKPIRPPREIISIIKACLVNN